MSGALQTNSQVNGAVNSNKLSWRLLWIIINGAGNRLPLLCRRCCGRRSILAGTRERQKDSLIQTEGLSELDF